MLQHTELQVFDGQFEQRSAEEGVFYIRPLLWTYALQMSRKSIQVRCQICYVSSYGESDFHFPYGFHITTHHFFLLER